MAWTYRFAESAIKNLQKLDPPQQQRILKYLDQRVEGAEDPRQLAEPLTSDHNGLWRFRCGDYRIVVEFQDEVATVLVVKVGHRSKVYR